MEQYRALRAYYTRNVVAKVAAHDVVATVDHCGDPNAVPLPATMIHELSSAFAQTGLPVRLKLFSSNPFPKRGARVLDEFQVAALEELRADPAGRYVTEQVIDGREFLRFSVADVMTDQVCVACHNSHAESATTDWVLGDVRGVLEVSMAIDESIAAAAALRGQVVGIGLLIIGVALLFTVPVVRRTSARVAADRERGIADRDRAMVHTVREQADQILEVVRSARGAT